MENSEMEPENPETFEKLKLLLDNEKIDYTLIEVNLTSF
jgi:hypothetical protein